MRVQDIPGDWVFLRGDTDRLVYRTPSGNWAVLRGSGRGDLALEIIKPLEVDA